MKIIILYSTVFLHCNLLLFSQNLNNGNGGLFGNKQNKKENAKSSAQDNTSPYEQFKKEHNKQIVFYKKAGEKGELSEANLVKKFSLTDSLTARFFLDKKISELLKDAYPSESEPLLELNAQVVLEWYFNGKLITETIDYVNSSNGRYRYPAFKKDFYNRETNYSGFLEWKEFITKCGSQLNVGTHIIQLKCYAKNGTLGKNTTRVGPLAIGSFELEVNKINYVLSDPLFCAPTPYEGRNAEVEESMKKAFEQNGLGKAENAVITSIFNETKAGGILKYRVFQGSIIHRNNNDCGYSTFQFKQYYGVSGYGICELLDKGVFTSFNCECLKK